MKRTHWILPALVAACAAACAVSTNDPDIGSTAAPLVVKPGLALQIAASGHGMAFDAYGKPITFTPSLIDDMQASIKAEALAAVGGKMSDETAALSKEVDTWLAKEPLKDVDRRVLEGARVWRLVRESTEKIRLQYEWRIDVINGQIDPRYQAGNWVVDARLRDLLRRIGLLDFSRFLNTDYMKRCSEQQVPVPPDWSETSTQWQYQGALTYNMLAPGDYAGVWTWEDPSKRGACVALPRGSGGPGSFAGIICQSAATGAACFWDNLLRAPAPGDRIEWASRTLQINQLQDGSNLSAPCTDCHTGNNVFLLTPDDPSWQHLLRDLPHEPGSNFTTQVEHSSDWRDDHYRYVPITTATPRPGWNNWRRAPGCSGGCHEQPSVAPITGTMPPTCGLAGCYAPR